MKINLDKIDSTKFVLIVLALTFLFCLIMSIQMKSINNNIFKLLEYQTKILGKNYEPEENIKTYTPTTQKEIDKYKNYDY